MLKKYRISSHVIIIGIIVFVLSPVMGCAQNEGNALTSKEQIQNKSGLKKNQITKTVKFQDQLSISAKFSEKIAALNKELSRTKTDLIKARVARVQKDKQISKMSKDIKSLQTLRNALAKETKDHAAKNKQINGLNSAVKNLQAVMKKKDTELVTLKKKIKSLQTGVSERDSELLTLDAEFVSLDKELLALDAELISITDTNEKYKNAVTCYRKALGAWDDLHRQEELTEQNLLTIAVELRREIGNCPGI